MARTAKLDLPLMSLKQDAMEVRVNELTYSFSAMHRGVVDDQLLTPPGTEVEEDAFIINGTATDEWAGLEDYIAVYTGSGWIYIAPSEGLRVFVKQFPKKFVIYTAGSWRNDSTRFPLPAAGGATGVGQTAISMIVNGDPARHMTTTIGQPMQYSVRVRSIIANIVHQHASDPGDWTIIVEDFAGGTVYFSETFRLNAAAGVAERQKVLNSLTNATAVVMSGNTTFQVRATGPATDTIDIVSMIEMERVYT